MTARMSLADRRSHLVDSALAVATAEGIGAATVRRVAERAGVALGVVHYCFADKDELVTELAARIVDDLAAHSAAGLTAMRADGGEPELASVVRAAVDGLWAGIEQTPDQQLLTYEITTFALRQPDRRDVAARLYEASQAAVVAVLTVAAQTCRCSWKRPVEEVAGEALALLDGVTLRWLVDGDSAAARRRLESFVTYLTGQATAPRRRRNPGRSGRGGAVPGAAR